MAGLGESIVTSSNEQSRSSSRWSSRDRRKATRARLITMVAVAITSSVLTASMAQAVDAVPSGDRCIMPVGADFDVVRSAVQVSASAARPEIFAWLDQPGAKAALRQLDEIDARRDSAVIGWFRDYLNQTIHVVTDPSMDGERERVAASFGAATADGANVVVESSCYSRSELDLVLERIAAEDWHDVADIARFVAIDPRIGRVLVRLEADKASQKETLEAMFGDKVRVELVADFGGLQSRTADAAPHKGGSALNNYSSAPPYAFRCTSGFTLVVSGVRKALTAGHCYAGFNTSVYSGPNYFGAKSASTNWYPANDLMLLYSSTTSYSNVIYTDPGTPSTRSINASRDANASDTNVCVSGYVSKNLCNFQPTSFSGGCWQPAGESTCWSTSYLTLLFGPGNNTQPGDSGAPSYVPSGSSWAVIVGMHAGTNGSGTSIIWRTSRIQTVTGGTVATS